MTCLSPKPVPGTFYVQACGRYVEGNPVEAKMTERSEDWPWSSSRYYFCGARDDLVDPYQYDGAPLIIEGDPEKYFSRGDIVGSDLFKIHIEEGAFYDMPVP